MTNSDMIKLTAIKATELDQKIDLSSAKQKVTDSMIKSFLMQDDEFNKLKKCRDINKLGEQLWELEQKRQIIDAIIEDLDGQMNIVRLRIEEVEETVCPYCDDGIVYQDVEFAGSIRDHGVKCKACNGTGLKN